jgi:hypothetical protein
MAGPQNPRDPLATNSLLNPKSGVSVEPDASVLSNQSFSATGGSSGADASGAGDGGEFISQESGE